MLEVVGFCFGLALLVLIAFFAVERRRRPTGTPSPGLHPEMDLPHQQEWTLYQNGLSLCSKKMRVCLAELDLPYESHDVELIETQAYENLRPEFLRINPGCTVPVLIHQGHPIYESHEQIVYAATQAGALGQRLLGETAEIQDAVARGVDFGALKGNPLAGGVDRAGDSIPGLTIPLFATMIRYIPWPRLGEGLFFHVDRRRPLLFMTLKLLGLNRLPPPLQKVIALARENMANHLDLLEDTLADGRPWLCGEPFTLADVGWMAIFERLEEADWMDLYFGEGRRPAVARYIERCQARPSYAAAAVPRGMIQRKGLEDLRRLKADSPTLRKMLEGR